MGSTDEALKARLLVEYGAAVEKVLARRGNREALTLDEIEGLAHEIGAKVEQGISQALVEEGSRPAVPGPECANCGQELHYKGQKGRYVETRSGTVRVERAYYYCEQCRCGFFPPG